MPLSVEGGSAMAVLVAVGVAAFSAGTVATLCTTRCSSYRPEQPQMPSEPEPEPEPEPQSQPQPQPQPQHEPEPELTEQTMIDAARTGDVDELSRCLAFGARIDAEDGNGRTALWWAARMNQVGAIEVLCEARADVEQADMRGLTPLIVAAGSGATEAVECLLGHGADWRRTFDGTATAKVAARTEGNSTTAALIQAWEVKFGATKELEDPYHKTKHALEEAMRQAARVGNADEVRRCLAAGADVDAGPGGVTALWLAAWENQIGPMQALVDAGADIERSDANGFTPLIAGAYTGSVAAVQFLLQRGANARHTASGGMTEAGAECRARTAVDIAKLQFKPEAVEVLETWQRPCEAAQGPLTHRIVH